MNESIPFENTHLSCPCGSSSDAYSTRLDGSGYCFSCDKNFSLSEEEKAQRLANAEITYDYVGHRGISRKTFEFYDVKTKFVDEVPDSVGFPYGKDAVKIRNLSNKSDMKTMGEFSAAPMFGMDRFDPGSKKSITITEGEFDAMAAYEMLKGSSACISIKSGSTSALPNLKKHYDYINSFERIYLCFDADKQGEEATRSVQGLFDFKKVYHVKFHKRKDPNDYLQNSDTDSFWQTWHSAKRFVPDNIISSFSDIAASLEVSAEDKLGEYPFPELNGKLYGLHAGEVVVVKAPEGVGKTEFFRALEYHILKSTKEPLGIIHLEEDNGTTVKAIAGYELKVPAVLPDCGLSKSDILAGYKRAVRDDEGRIHIHSSFDVEDESAFIGNIRFLVSALGCRFIFLDHISWLATGNNEDDERRKLDRISQKLKLLAKELRFCLIMISHVNDNGQTRGSRNISKVANTVISLNRDILEDSLFTNFLIEKARLGGRTGRAGSGYFSRETGTLMSSEEYEEQQGKDREL